ncbi:transglycosylase domain-containing protein [Calidifontibacter terrae]
MTDSDLPDETEGDTPSSPRPARSRRSGRRKGKKKRPMWLRVLLGTFLGFFTIFVIGVVALVIVYLRTQIPPANANANRQLSIVYYSDGKTELDRFNADEGNREDVKLGQIPTAVQYEFLAAEDRNFYTNNGVSPTGIMRALWTNLKGGGNAQGGSTITQQYVKNYFLSQDKTYTRKLKEAMIAIKIDHKYSKQQILEDYLNNIYFGRNTYGIQAASKVYFNKDVSQLNPSEGAFLASVINAPGFYDPANGAKAETRVRQRMTYVLDGMVSQGWMTPAVRAQQTYPTIQGRKTNQYASGPTGYITATVRAELKSKLKLSDQDIDRGGLRITTTIDKNDQQAAVTAVENGMPNSSKDLHAGLVAQKPDGSIVAMYGGADYRVSQYSSANQAALQGGSSFKVFALTAALQNGYTLNNRFDGSSPLKLPGSTKPITNDAGEQFGSVTLSQALKFSVNTAFVRMNMAMGPAKTKDAAIQVGIPASSPGLNNNGNNVLGEASVRVSDMTNAFSTIASGGKKADPHVIAKVTSTSGAYSYTAKGSTTQAVDAKVANNVAVAMEGPVKPGGTAYQALQDFTRPAGGKTGTTNNYRSAWFTGFTPNQLTASVGMYAGDGSATTSLSSEGQSFYGGTVPALIWKNFMQSALQGQPVAQMPKATQQATQTVAPPVQSTTTAPSTTAPSTTSTSSTSTSTSSTTTSTSSAPTSTSTSTSSAPTSTSQPPTSTSAPPASTSQPSLTTPPAASAPGAGSVPTRSSRSTRAAAATATSGP